MDTLAQNIRILFPGIHNKGLRAHLRALLVPRAEGATLFPLASDRLRTVRRTVALTALGRAKLDQLIALAEAQEETHCGC